MVADGGLGAAARRVARAAAAVTALDDAAGRLIADREAVAVEPAIARGYFRPAEEERLIGWFARFLTVRAGFWEVVGDLRELVGRRFERLAGASETEVVAGSGEDWRAFLVGYAAACAIVRLDRHLLEEVATERLTQRKLNEGSGALRIPRKQYTAIFKSFTDPAIAWSMLAAMRTAERARPQLAALSGDPVVGGIARRLAGLERGLDSSRRRYLDRAVRYRDHSLRRRMVSATQQVAFAVLERSGRVVSEIQDRWTPKRVTEEVRRALAGVLRPGDVLVTRHERAFTNLFLPGYWPHAALYVGSEADRERLGVALDPERARRWSGDCRTLEALKDGVRFRPLEETLSVDAFAVVRPRLAEAEIALGLARASEHEGKLYNFDFDFFRSDRLVCTEVVYRGLDGLGGIEIPLRERAERPTLAAEDLLDLALAGRGFEPVAVFGTPDCPARLVLGGEAATLLRRSYRSDS
jgi:hypothetical protein